MGLVDRKRTGNIINSKLVVPNQPILTAKIQKSEKISINIKKNNGNN